MDKPEIIRIQRYQISEAQILKKNRDRGIKNDKAFELDNMTVFTEARKQEKHNRRNNQFSLDGLNTVPEEYQSKNSSKELKMQIFFQSSI